MRNILLASFLGTAVVAFGFSKAEGCWRQRVSCQPTSSLFVTAISPSGPLILGEDLTVHYRVASGVTFDNVKLRVTNINGDLVYLSANLPVSAGEHQAVWPKGKWNQGPHSGAFANPRNGPYMAALVAESPDGSSISYSISLPTQLVLHCDLVNDRPSPEEISSGIYRPALDPNSSECLRIGLLPRDGKLADTIYALAAPEFSDIVEEDLDNDPSDGLEVKSAHLRQVMQSTFPDGTYHVVLTNLRNLAGNRGLPGMPDGIVETWKVNLR